MESTKKFHYINKIREDRRGGGVAIGVKVPFIVRDISHKLPDAV